MGTVYAAFDETLRRMIALKVLDAGRDGDDTAARWDASWRRPASPRASSTRASPASTTWGSTTASSS